MTIDPRTIAADIMCGNARSITPSEVWAHIGQAYDVTEIDATIADDVADLIAKTGIDLIWPDGTKNTELDAARVEIARLQGLLRHEEQEHSRTIADRDAYHEVGDQLAAIVAKLTGVDVGEHSNMNDPWQNALQAGTEHAERAGVDGSANTTQRPSYVGLVAALRSEFNAVALEALRIQLIEHRYDTSSLGTLVGAVVDAGNITYDAGTAVHPAVRAWFERNYPGQSEATR